MRVAVLHRFYCTEKCISTDQEELAESHPFKEIDWELGALCYFLFHNHLAGKEKIDFFVYSLLCIACSCVLYGHEFVSGLWSGHFVENLT